MMDTKYFPMFHSYLETLSGLTDEQFGRVIRSALRYSVNGVVPALDGAEAMAFAFIKLDVDRARDKYEAIAERNRANGMKGGRPRKQEKPSGFSENSENPKEPKKPIETAKEKEKENAKETATSTGAEGSRTVGGAEGRKSGFVIPSISDVAGYCVKQGYTHVDVEEFCRFYDTNGWTVGDDGEPMKNWKAVLRGWEERAKNKPKPAAKARPAETSFDTDDFFDAALMRTYGENWEFMKKGMDG